MSYSYGSEDEFLKNFFGPEYQGTFLDIGANDGLTMSNTRALVDRGWRGYMIEPDPRSFAALQKLYPEKAYGRQLTLSQVMISDCPYMSTNSFWIAEDHPSMFSTGRKEYRDHMQQTSNMKFEEIQSPTLTVAAYCTIHKIEHVDLFTTDTEGLDERIICSMDLTGFRPTLILAEIDKFGAEQPIEEHLSKRGYKRVWQDHGNAAWKDIERS